MTKLYGRQITEEEHREIRDKLEAYFELLIKTDRTEKEKPQTQHL